MRCLGRAPGRSIQLAPVIKSRDWSGKIAGKYRIPNTNASFGKVLVPLVPNE